MALSSEVSEMPGAPRRGGKATKVTASMRGLPSAAPLQEIGVRAEGRNGHASTVTQAAAAVSAANSEIVGTTTDEGEVGQKPNATHHGLADLANIIAEIREQWRRRQAWHRAEKSLTLQAKALCRRLAEGGDKGEADRIYRAALGKGSHPMGEVALLAMLPLDDARRGIERHRKAVEKRLSKLAEALPVAPWVKGTRGVGLASLAAIVGEAGDLSNYANPAKLWKRMGLAVMPDGRQRRISGVAALDHGYSPARRSVMWNVGACIVKAGGPLKAVYDARKLYEAERVKTKMHAHNRAQRYVEKRFLRELWSVWRKTGEDQSTLDLEC